MEPREMDRLINAHMKAESASDVEGTVALYTADVEHDVVGLGAVHGIPAVRERYTQLMADFKPEEEVTTHAFYAQDACTIEHLITARVPGSMLGIPGNNRRIKVRVLHIFEFRDGLISRENVWLDGAAIAEQLTSPQPVA